MKLVRSSSSQNCCFHLGSLWGWQPRGLCSAALVKDGAHLCRGVRRVLLPVLEAWEFGSAFPTADAAAVTRSPDPLTSLFSAH